MPKKITSAEATRAARALEAVSADLSVSPVVYRGRQGILVVDADADAGDTHTWYGGEAVRWVLEVGPEPDYSHFCAAFRGTPYPKKYWAGE